MLVQSGMIKMSMQAKQAMGARRRPAKPPVAIAMSHRNQFRLSGGGTPPPRGPNSTKKLINLALGNISLLAGGLICALSGTLTGLLLLPPALFFLARAFHKP